MYTLLYDDETRHYLPDDTVENAGGPLAYGKSRSLPVEAWEYVEDEAPMVDPEWDEGLLTELTELNGGKFKVEPWHRLLVDAETWRTVTS